jgi:hypothetical protein
MRRISLRLCFSRELTLCLHVLAKVAIAMRSVAEGRALLVFKYGAPSGKLPCGVLTGMLRY